MTTEVSGGATRWKFFLQASRSFLNRSGRLISRKNLEKRNFKFKKNSEIFKNPYVHEKWRKYRDSRGGTDTPGPGESVSAIRFNGKIDFSMNKNRKNETRKFQSYVLMFSYFSLFCVFIAS